MRFRTTAKYEGKGQKDLKARVHSLMAMGEPEAPRNEHCPHLYSRRAVCAAEILRGVMWSGKQKQHYAIPAGSAVQS